MGQECGLFSCVQHEAQPHGRVNTILALLEDSQMVALVILYLGAGGQHHRGDNSSRGTGGCPGLPLLGSSGFMGRTGTIGLSVCRCAGVRQDHTIQGVNESPLDPGAGSPGCKPNNGYGALPFFPAYRLPPGVKQGDRRSRPEDPWHLMASPGEPQTLCRTRGQENTEIPDVRQTPTPIDRDRWYRRDAA
jgi:hypothetical protein